MRYNYLARDNKGEVQAGSIEAPDRETAVKTLQGHDLVVVKLEKFQKSSILTKRIRIFERVKKRDVFVIFRQLSVLIGADVPLVQSLKALSHQTESKRLKEVFFDLAREVDGGMAFSKALAKYPRIFSDFIISLVKTGEVSGRLEESVNYLADYLEKEYYLVSKVRGAMIYPAFILLAFLGVGILILVMVIPTLTSILTESGQALPMSTRIVIGTSNFVRSWGWILLLILIIGGIVLWRYRKNPLVKSSFDRMILRLPIFGKVLKKTYLARLSDNLTALIKGGVSILKSLSIAAETIGNSVYRRILYKARDEVKAGRNISSVLEKYPEFTPLFIQMVKVGEQTGTLSEILTKLSDFYSKEVDNVVNNLTQLIEPVLIVAIGLGVGVLIFSVFVPIYSLAGAF